MARGREGAAKRARERIRKEKQDAKRARRHESSDETPDDTPPVDESRLMEEFRVLSERHAAGALDDDAYQEDRHRIFVELGIETEEDG